MMDTLIRLNVDNARRSHRVSVWFSNQAKVWGGWYSPYADKLRREAWEFLAEARRIKAGMEQERAA